MIDTFNVLARWVTAHFYHKRDFTDVSRGDLDAARPVRMDATGKLDNSLLRTGHGNGLDADTVDGSHASAFATSGHTHSAPAHSDLSGLGGDDHTHYLKADGTRSLTGDWDIGTGRKISGDTLAARSAGGLRIEDDGNNLGVFVKDGGQVGIGTTTTDTPLCVTSPVDGPIARFSADDGSDTASFLLYGYTNDYATTFQQDSILFYASTSVTALHIAAAKSGGRIGFVTDGVPTSTTERMRLTSTGLGISAGGDTFDPQGALHVHQGTGGCALFVKTGIVGSAQTLIPDGAGDVVRGCRIMGVGYSSAPAPFDISSFIAPTGNYDIVVGSSTLRFSVSSAGALTVIRQAGTHTFQISVWVIWL